MGRREECGRSQGLPFLRLAATLLLLASVPGTSAGEEWRLPREMPRAGYAPTSFTLPDTSGQPVSLSDFQGMVILLSFWSCYSDACFSSVSILRDFIREFGPEKFVVPTVCSEVPEALAVDRYSGLLRHCSVGQVVLVDEEKRVQELYNLDSGSLPVAFLIGPDFTIEEVVKSTSRLREEGFRSKIAKLVEEASSLPLTHP